MGLHRSVKRTSKIRRERKQSKRAKVATRALQKEGKPVTEAALKSTVKDLQEKHKDLQERLSKKKERKIVKQLIRKKRLQSDMEVDVGRPQTGKRRQGPVINDVEMQ